MQRSATDLDDIVAPLLMRPSGYAGLPPLAFAADDRLGFPALSAELDCDLLVGTLPCLRNPILRMLPRPCRTRSRRDALATIVSLGHQRCTIC